jgi:hypothetical protein
LAGSLGEALEETGSCFVAHVFGRAPDGMSRGPFYYVYARDLILTIFFKKNNRDIITMDFEEYTMNRKIRH